MSSEHPEIPKPEPETGADPVPRPVAEEKVIVIGRPEEGEWVFAGPPPVRRKGRGKLALILLVFTCASTFLLGANHQQPLVSIGDWVGLLARLLHMDAHAWQEWVIRGLSYSLAVMSILGAHELGHYLQARRYGVPASFPFFIPFPVSPFGTMGAVIVQQPGVADRKSMFDIAITGPLAGLIVALPIAYVGIRTAKIEPIPRGTVVEIFEDPLLLKGMVYLIRGPVPEGHDLIINPALFAGWVGVFITALNLIPIGQLDGGHILYCLIGRRAHYVARAIFFAAAGIVAFNVFFRNGAYVVWCMMLFLIWIFGTRHPPTANDRARLGPIRILLGSLTLMFIFIGLTPTPFRVEVSKPRPVIKIQPDKEVVI